MNLPVRSRDFEFIAAAGKTPFFGAQNDPFFLDSGPASEHQIPRNCGQRLQRLGGKSAPKARHKPAQGNALGTANRNPRHEGPQHRSGLGTPFQVCTF
jgi:hypothetical protein